MVEEKSKFSILVIEDNPEFGKNALEALKGLDVTLVVTLEDAMDSCMRGKFDFILSDAHVPVREREEPTPIISEVMAMCYGKGIPICFVTKADHHGLLHLGDEGIIALKATTPDRVGLTELELFRSGNHNPSEASRFFKLETSGSENIRSDSKTPAIWSRALEMVKDALTKPTPVGGAIKKVRGLGLDVEMKGNMPKVVPAKLKK